MSRQRIPCPSPSLQPWLRPGEEPRLAEVLADPLVHLVMRRDGVSRAQLEAVIAAAQAQRRCDCGCRCAA